MVFLATVVGIAPALKTLGRLCNILETSHALEKDRDIDSNEDSALNKLLPLRETT